MKIGDLVRIKGLARPENADVGIVIGFKVRGVPYDEKHSFVEATVQWNGQKKLCRYWSSDLEVIQ